MTVTPEQIKARGRPEGRGEKRRRAAPAFIQCLRSLESPTGEAASIEFVAEDGGSVKLRK